MFSPASVDVCEQLLGANLIVRLPPNLVSHCHTLGHMDEVITFWKVKVKGQGRCGGMRSTEPSSIKIEFKRTSEYLLSEHIDRVNSTKKQ